MPETEQPIMALARRKRQLQSVASRKLGSHIVGFSSGDDKAHVIAPDGS